MGSPQEEDYSVVFMPDQAMRSISEDLICELDSACSLIGQLHRIAITDNVLPSPTQIQYLMKAHTEIGKTLNFLIDLTAPPRHEG